MKKTTLYGTISSIALLVVMSDQIAVAWMYDLFGGDLAKKIQAACAGIWFIANGMKNVNTQDTPAQPKKGLP